ncbi:MAG: biotin--[acetyl-CoA-carboxylase] ligase [Acetatifactor sp.]
MKAEILSLLRERGDYVSGQELCQRFGVSRTAVWKAMNQLKKEGYRIEAVQNKGYLLLTDEEVYSQNELESRMETIWAGHPVTFYKTLDSTNLRAKLDAENGAPEGALVVADMQTAGRGRRGRSWQSPAGINAYFTLLLKPEYSPDKASMVTLIMALAVAEGIRETCKIPAQIKWPNDVVINGKKTCGILSEMSLERDFIQHIVVGTGINVGLQEFPPEIAVTATCLQAECGEKISRAVLIANVMKAFEKYYGKFRDTLNLSLLREQYESLLVNRNKEVRVLDPKGEYSGMATGITDTGELLVELPDGRVTPVYAGEVSVRGVYGYV